MSTESTTFAQFLWRSSPTSGHVHSYQNLILHRESVRNSSADRLGGYTLAAMANLRLFANLREIAGTSRIDIPARTVGDVIVAANEKFGAEFERGVETARVWVNGEEAGLADTVTERDEVVLLPPVSGGAQPATMVVADLLGFVPLAVLAVVVLANLQSQAIWAAALVAITAFWALDLNTSFAGRGRTFAPLAVVTTSAAGALAAHILGGAGYGLSVALAVVDRSGLGGCLFRLSPD